MADLLTELVALAERGEPRGAVDVLRAARADAEGQRQRRKRAGVGAGAGALAVGVLAALLGVTLARGGPGGPRVTTVNAPPAQGPGLPPLASPTPPFTGSGVVPAGEPDTNHDGRVVIGILSPGDTHDHGTNEDFVDQASALAHAKGWTVVTTRNVTDSGAGQAALALCRQHADLIAGPAELRGAVTAASDPACKDVFFYLAGEAGLAQAPTFTQSIDDPPEEGYASGVAAGLVMKDRGITVAGFLTGPEATPTAQFYRAWAAGIHSVDPSASVLATYTGDFNDGSLAEQAFAAQVSRGARLVYPYLAGGALATVTSAALRGHVSLLTPGTDDCSPPFAVAVVFSPGAQFAAALGDFASGTLPLGVTRHWRIGTDPVPTVHLCQPAAGDQARVDQVMQAIGAGRIDPLAGVVAARSLPPGPPEALGVAGPLAVGPSGDLYVADVAHDRILVRAADGSFRVVAGNGHAGFSGDGGAAIDAELSGVSDLAAAADGTLYLADGDRVRTVSPDGTIRTVAGSGLPGATVADGTPALSASLAPQNSLAIALSPSGQLYITTGDQLLRLSGGRLYTVPAVASSGPLKGRSLDGLGQIAIDGRGDVDVSGFTGWSIWQVATAGSATQVGNGEQRRSGGDTSVLERAPDGDVYGESGPALERIEGQSMVPAFTFDDSYFLTYFAFAPDGTIYADETPGGVGFEAHQQIVSVSNQHVNVLWQEGTSAAK